MIQNAIIANAEIDNDDHGCLTAWIMLEYEKNGGQCFGGYVLYRPESWQGHSKRGVAGHFIYRVMEIAGVHKWSGLKGKTIRVKGEGTLGSTIDAIGHIINDDWFNPKEDLKP